MSEPQRINDLMAQTIENLINEQLGANIVYQRIDVAELREGMSILEEDAQGRWKRVGTIARVQGPYGSCAGYHVALKERPNVQWCYDRGGSVCVSPGEAA